MNRLETTLNTLQSAGRKAFIPFTMAGDGGEAQTLDMLHGLVDAGADILELGMPFTDPMADGPIIQAAGLRALANGMSLVGVLDIVQQFRSRNKITPLILMGYYNPILAYGEDRLCNNCNSLGIDGLIAVDVPPEEGGELFQKLQQKSIAFIRFLTPTTPPQRLPMITAQANGFLYYVSVAGVTGKQQANVDTVAGHLTQIRPYITMPVMAGFGIKTPEDAAAMAAATDGVVVGSALVEACHQDGVGTALALAKALRSAL